MDHPYLAVIGVIMTVSVCYVFYIAPAEPTQQQKQSYCESHGLTYSRNEKQCIRGKSMAGLQELVK